MVHCVTISLFWVWALLFRGVLPIPNFVTCSLFCMFWCLHLFIHGDVVTPTLPTLHATTILHFITYRRKNHFAADDTSIPPFHSDPRYHYLPAFRCHLRRWHSIPTVTTGKAWYIYFYRWLHLRPFHSIFIVVCYSFTLWLNSGCGHGLCLVFRAFLLILYSHCSCYSIIIDWCCVWYILIFDAVALLMLFCIDTVFCWCNRMMYSNCDDDDYSVMLFIDRLLVLSDLLALSCYCCSFCCYCSLMLMIHSFIVLFPDYVFWVRFRFGD